MFALLVEIFFASFPKSPKVDSVHLDVFSGRLKMLPYLNDWAYIKKNLNFLLPRKLKLTKKNCITFFRACDWPAGLHAKEQILPPGGAVPGRTVYRRHCCGLWPCARHVLHWRRLCLGLQQQWTGNRRALKMTGCAYIADFNILPCCVLMRVFQLGLGHTNSVKEPTLVAALQGKNIRQISAGRCHSSAWTTPSTSMKNSGTDTYGVTLHTLWWMNGNTPGTACFTFISRWLWKFPVRFSTVSPSPVHHSERL